MRSKNEALFVEIIEFVNRYFEKNGRSPSTREIEGEIGLSHVTVQRYLQVLRERGEIEYDGHRSQETAKQGNIVAFLYDNEQTTLKRYKQTDDAIYLCPENDSMEPIVIRGEDRAKLRIQGVATGIIKKIE